MLTAEDTTGEGGKKTEDRGQERRTGEGTSEQAQGSAAAFGRERAQEGGGPVGQNSAEEGGGPVREDRRQERGEGGREGGQKRGEEGREGGQDGVVLYHERQEMLLCGMHALNALLQGPFFDEVQLADLAQKLDRQEREVMAEAGLETPEFLRFVAEGSANVANDGNFSIQVLQAALQFWGLTCISIDSSDAKSAKDDPHLEMAFICHLKAHWFAIRRVGDLWFDFNSLHAAPKALSDFYLSAYLTTLQAEGWTVFVVRGNFPSAPKFSHNLVTGRYFNPDSAKQAILEAEEEARREEAAAAAAQYGEWGSRGSTGGGRGRGAGNSMDWMPSGPGAGAGFQAWSGTGQRLGGGGRGGGGGVEGRGGGGGGWPQGFSGSSTNLGASQGASSSSSAGGVQRDGYGAPVWPTAPPLGLDEDAEADADLDAAIAASLSLEYAAETQRCLGFSPTGEALKSQLGATGGGAVRSPLGATEGAAVRSQLGATEGGSMRSDVGATEGASESAVGGGAARVPGVPGLPVVPRVSGMPGAPGLLGVPVVPRDSRLIQGGSDGAGNVQGGGEQQNQGTPVAIGTPVAPGDMSSGCGTESGCTPDAGGGRGSTTDSGKVPVHLEGDCTGIPVKSHTEYKPTEPTNATGLAIGTASEEANVSGVSQFEGERANGPVEPKSPLATGVGCTPNGNMSDVHPGTGEVRSTPVEGHPSPIEVESIGMEVHSATVEVAVQLPSGLRLRRQFLQEDLVAAVEAYVQGHVDTHVSFILAERGPLGKAFSDRSMTLGAAGVQDKTVLILKYAPKP